MTGAPSWVTVSAEVVIALHDDLLSTAAISQGHRFNDGNKRTAFQVMDVILTTHGLELDWDTEEAGQRMIELAQSRMDESSFAHWLRAHAGR